MGGEGLEAGSVTAKPSNELRDSDFSRAANSGVFSSDSHSEALSEASVAPDPRLSRLIERWPTLPERVRAAVMRLLDDDARSAKGKPSAQPTYPPQVS